MAKGYRGGFGGGGVNMNMIKQAQKMQQDMMKMQEEMEAKEYTASAGGGAVTATISGARELKKIVFKPEIVDPDDIEMLQDLTVAAINEAMRLCSEDSANSMGKLTSGMNIPGLF